jgi:YHS domain-containing protein
MIGLIRVIIYGVLFYAIYRVVVNFLRPREVRPVSSGKGDLPVQREDLVEDPCCHTYIPVSSACKFLYDGKPVYFCSQKCLEEYRSQRGR